MSTLFQQLVLEANIRQVQRDLRDMDKPRGMRENVVEHCAHLPAQQGDNVERKE